MDEQEKLMKEGFENTFYAQLQILRKLHCNYFDITVHGPA